MGCATVTSGGGGGAKALVLGLQPLTAHADAGTISSVSTRSRRRGTFPCRRMLRRSFGVVIRHLLLLDRRRHSRRDRSQHIRYVAARAAKDQQIRGVLIARREDVPPVRPR